MTLPTKPGDTAVAKAIGTYPELPDGGLDNWGDDPQWWVEHFFIEHERNPRGAQHYLAYGGPLGTAVATVDANGVYTVTTKDGVVFTADLRRRVGA